MNVNIKEKIILFGVGENGIKAYCLISERRDIFRDEYIAFSDNDRHRWNQNLFGIPIICPDKINEIEPDRIVICSLYHKMIARDLINKLQIRSTQIESFEDYSRRLWCRYQYDKRYGKVYYKNNKNEYDLNRIVVYTAITGDYDQLKEPCIVEDNTDYVCFTNNRSLRSKVWNIEYVEDDKLDDMHLAKVFKLEPHRYFKEYHTSIWVDGKFQIIGKLRDYITKYEKDSSMLCFPHFERDCIYEEAAACIHYHLGEVQKIIQQISQYYMEEYPFHNGLYEMGCIVRKHNDEKLIAVMEDWKREIWKYSYRDQLSFPVVCRRDGFLPDICSENGFCNPWLKVYNHRFK